MHSKWYLTAQISLLQRTLDLAGIKNKQMIIQMNSKGRVGADLIFNTEKNMYFHHLYYEVASTAMPSANEKEGFNASCYHKSKNY